MELKCYKVKIDQSLEQKGIVGKQKNLMCEIIETYKDRRKDTNAIPDQQYLTSKFYQSIFKYLSTISL